MSDIFKRVEKKYLLSGAQCEAFLAALGDRIVPDEYGEYSISNIYYDTPQEDLIRRSLEKPLYKEKLRLRSYGTPGEEDTVFLELKKKWEGIVYKRRVELPYRVARAYLSEGVYPEAYDCQILREIDYAIRYYGLRANVFLAYDRRAYVVREAPQIRFTIDTGIRSRSSQMELAAGDKGRRLFKDDTRLLEIKAPGALPLWFVRILDELDIRSTSFSKYGRVYQESLKRRRFREVSGSWRRGEEETRSGGERLRTGN